MSYYQIFIMATSNSCNVCFKRVLRHSYHLQCELCKNLTHLKCLPNVDKNSSIYVSRETSTWYCTVCSENIFPYNHIHDDDDFLYALSHNWDLPETVSFEILRRQNALFLPLELNDNYNNPLAETDPDIHYYNNQCNNLLNSCDYYIEDSFNKKIEELNIHNNSFSLIHSNMRSAKKNLSSFDTYLSSFDHKFTIVAVSESWFKDHNYQLYGLEN